MHLFSVAPARRGVWCPLGLAALILLPVLVHAQEDPDRLKPLPHPVGHPPSASPARAGGSGSGATAGTWTPLTNQLNLFDGIGNPVLLTDGTVLVQDAGYNDWYRLTPDKNGSYVNGTWTQIANAPYNPLYHSTQVLPDGRMIIEGGEYLCTVSPANCNPTWTSLGAIYDPVANAWTAIAPPAGWDPSVTHTASCSPMGPICRPTAAPIRQRSWIRGH